MIEKIARTKWLRYLIEIITLTLIFGLVGGVIIGLIRGWKYALNEFYLPFVDTLSFSINESLFVAFVFLFIFSLVFLALLRMIKSIRGACLISSAISCVPFFLLWGYRINQESGIYWSKFFKGENIVFNLKISAGFILLWLLVSIVLLYWVRLRILETSAVRIKHMSVPLLIVLAFNVSALLFHKLRVDDSPNVLVILIDCLRADHVSSYGYERNTTPNIDDFSKDAVTFTQAISQSTFTKTSIASLFTSKYPYQHGMYAGHVDGNKGFSDVLGKDETTLAEILIQNGFLTEAWLQQGQLMSYMGFSQGFIHYNERAGNVKAINRKFIKWVKRVGKNHKFFAYLHYLDLHAPYRPKPPYNTLYGEYSDPYLNSVRNHQDLISLAKSKKRGLEQKDIDQLKAYYDGELTYIDNEIGILLKELKKEGLYDNTLIILTSDHGEGFMEHGFVSHSNTPYDELIRVPLIVKFPDSLYSGKAVENQVRLIDVVPTILDFLKIQTYVELSGFSLLNYLSNNNKADFPEFAISELGTQISVRTERFKYIHFPNKEGEFYDLSADPKEKNNIVNLKADKVEKFRKIALSAALEAERRRKDTEKITFDNETVEELKALGYIQ